ncbi:MAG TPA: hypothetical protein VGM30_10260 [Puia sp.]|jgi:hypothetical protein
MLYQLSTGKTVELTFAQWASITDEDIEYLIATGHGEEIESPWRGSALERTEAPEKGLPELPDIPISEKLEEYVIED